jgi:oligopeptide/dipeptide ABC transporter ATP-binding protein
MAIILITHDLAVVARMADRVNVMYAGEIVERGNVDDIFYRSAHPYTLGLRDAMPNSRSERSTRLQPIDGSPPDLFSPPTGCGYFARCPFAMRVCREHPPLFDVDVAHASRCWLQHDGAPPAERLFVAARQRSA